MGLYISGVLKYQKLLKYLLVLTLIWFSLRSNADNFLKDPKLDSNYIEDYRHLLTARFYLLRESISFSITPDEITGAIKYRHNSHVRLGVAGFYKWLGV